MLDLNGYREKINKAALEHYELMLEEKETTNARTQLFFLVYEMLSNIKEYEVNGSDACVTLMADSAADLLPLEKLRDIFERQLRTWQPVKASFFYYFESLFKKRIKNELKSRNRTVSYNVCFDDEESNTEILDTILDSSFTADTENSIEMKLMLKEYFDCLVNEIMTKKTMYDNSPKFCYETRFFTEYLTCFIYEYGIAKANDTIPQKALNAIDKDFAAYYLHKKGSPINPEGFMDIADSELRPLSHFTGEESDKSTPCGYWLRNIVYTEYYRKVKGKNITASSVSPKKKDFDRLLEAAGLNGFHDIKPN